MYHQYSPKNSPRQSASVEVFAEANSVFIVMTSAKTLPKLLFPSKMYIQFICFQYLFLDKKLSLTNKRYHLHVPMSVRTTRIQVYYIFRQFIHPFLFVHVALEQALLSRCMPSYRQNSVMSHF